MCKSTTAENSATLEQQYQELQEKTIQTDGVTYQLGLYAPTEGEGSVKLRLTHLMERGQSNA